MICASQDFLRAHSIACNASKNAGAVRAKDESSWLSTALSTKISSLIFSPEQQKHNDSLDGAAGLLHCK
jgi:hypothetical protein